MKSTLALLAIATLSACDSESNDSLLGTWQLTVAGKRHEQVTFRADGTLERIDPLGTREGHYQIVDGDRLDMEQAFLPALFAVVGDHLFFNLWTPVGDTEGIVGTWTRESGDGTTTITLTEDGKLREVMPDATTQRAGTWQQIPNHPDVIRLDIQRGNDSVPEIVMIEDGQAAMWIYSRAVPPEKAILGSWDCPQEGGVSTQMVFREGDPLQAHQPVEVIGDRLYLNVWKKIGHPDGSYGTFQTGADQLTFMPDGTLLVGSPGSGAPNGSWTPPNQQGVMSFQYSQSAPPQIVMIDSNHHAGRICSRR